MALRVICNVIDQGLEKRGYKLAEAISFPQIALIGTEASRRRLLRIDNSMDKAGRSASPANQRSRCCQMRHAAQPRRREDEPWLLQSTAAGVECLRKAISLQ